MRSLSELLNEMAPQRIQLSYGYVKEYQEDILNNIEKAKLLSVESRDVGFYSLTTSKGNYYFLYKDRIIYYFVHYKEFPCFKNISKTPFRQCLVWRNKINRTGATVGFAKKVFWDILFKKYNAVISDSQQSKEGEGLWDNLIQQAFEKGYIVKVHNTNDKSFKEYKSFDDLDNDKDSHYGDSNFYQRFIISIEKP